jgi:imidazolonepropionase-like amidohydrolase
MIREGDAIKINLSGDNWVRRGFSETVTYTDAEVAAAVEQWKDHSVKLACHSHATRAIKLALKYDVDVLYHCEYADGKRWISARPRRIRFSSRQRSAFTKEIAERNGILVTIACDAFRKMRKRGIRALPGAITVLPGTRSATTRATSNISSSFSTTRPRKCSALRPNMAAN